MDGRSSGTAVRDRGMPVMGAACTLPEAPRAAAPCRERTAASRRRSVEDAIGAMRERLGEPLSLPAIARTAASSPYHFDRVFHQVTGLPPFRFLAALRLDAARRLLLTTRYSATSICFEVGYSSVGSFTRQFAEAVGMPPARLRGFAAAGAGPAALSRVPHVADAPAASRGGLAGTVRAPDGFAGAVFVGAFSTPLPSGRPAACALLREGGPFRLGPLPDGVYHVFAAGMAAAPGAPPAQALLQDDALRAVAGPVEVRGGKARPPVELVLRPRDPVDPPILVSLPVLLAERLSRGAGDDLPPHHPGS
jgi:AraC family transcriptional regulator